MKQAATFIIWWKIHANQLIKGKKMTSLQPVAFTIPQRVLHWGMALLIFFNLLFADGMEAWDRLTDQGQTPTPDQLASANIHAYVGITILVLAAVRLCLRFTSGAPPVIASEPFVLQIASKIAHAAFYILFFAMPLSGIAKYYFDVDFAGFVHAGPLKLLMWVLIVVHIAAALVHQFYWKTDVVKRMTRG